jgi:flagellar biosynthesis/type III secretory pathway chaperone
MTVRESQGKASVLKRLREMLLRQKDKFRQYLDLLEQEGSSIADGDTERLQVQLELEKILIGEIHTLHRVIEPLEDLYRAAYPKSEESIPALKAVLADMGAQMKERNAKNRAALRMKMEELKGEIAGLRAWPRAQSGPEASPSLIDITA